MTTTNVFPNFMEAVATAEVEARKTITDGAKYPNVVFYVLESRKTETPISLKENMELQAIYNESFRDAKTQILTNFIMSGRVRECRLSRHFMATGQFWHN